MSDENHPHPIDITVGSRVRRARLSRGMSQSALAEQIGVTFQQVQKYENGSNRISASKLVEIADHLGVPPASFFDGLGLHGGSENGLKPSPSGGGDLLAMFAELPPPMRQTVLQITKSLLETVESPAMVKRAPHSARRRASTGEGDKKRRDATHT